MFYNLTNSIEENNDPGEWTFQKMLAAIFQKA